MDKQFCMKYIKSIRLRYLDSDKAGKSAILSEFCRVCRYERKYAITLLHKQPDAARPARATPKRPITYGPAIQAILIDVWE